jgi:hypothetical protein
MSAHIYLSNYKFRGQSVDRQIHGSMSFVKQKWVVAATVACRTGTDAFTHFLICLGLVVVSHPIGRGSEKDIAAGTIVPFR